MQQISYSPAAVSKNIFQGVTMGNTCDCYKPQEEEDSEVAEAKPEPEQEEEHEEDIVRTKHTTYNLTTQAVGMWRRIVA